MRDKITCRIVSGLTARGFRTYLPAFIAGARIVAIIKGRPGTGKSTLIRRVVEEMAQRGFAVEYLISPLDPAYMEGVLFPQIKAVIITGEIGERWTGAEQKRIEMDLDSALQGETLSLNYQEIELLAQQVREYMLKAMEDLRRAGKLQEEGAENRDGSEELWCQARKLADALGENQAREEHFFGSCMTCRGVYEAWQDAASTCRRRYIIRGCKNLRSRFIEIVGRELLDRGWGVSFFHSGFDPEQLEMVVARGLEVALLDEALWRGPLGPGDETIDLGESEPENGEEPRRRSIACLQYQAMINMQKAREAEKKLGRLYTLAIDFGRLDRQRDELLLCLLNGTCPSIS